MRFLAPCSILMKPSWRAAMAPIPIHLAVDAEAVALTKSPLRHCYVLRNRAHQRYSRRLPTALILVQVDAVPLLNDMFLFRLFVFLRGYSRHSSCCLLRQALWSGISHGAGDMLS